MTESPFEPAPDVTDWVWLNHDGGVPAHFPAAAAPLWQARGWKVCDPPPEIDPTRIEQPAKPAAPAKSKKE